MTKKVDKQLVLSIIADADVLAKQHEVFVDQYVTRANDELYRILSEMMSICLQVQASNAKHKIVEMMRKKLRENFGVKTQTNSRIPSIVVRYVIRSNRKTAHIYGRVIEVAIADGITPEELPDYINKKGGVDAIRQSVVAAEAVNNNKAINERIDAVFLEYLRNKLPIGEVNLFNKGLLPSSADVAFTYLICRDNPSRTGLDVIGSMYPSSTIESKALELLALNSIVMKKYGTNEFGRLCMENTLNQDIMFNWMKTNGFGEMEDVKNFYDEINTVQKTLPKLNGAK